jgi:hypothetical protein
MFASKIIGIWSIQPVAPLLDPMDAVTRSICRSDKRKEANPTILLLSPATNIEEGNAQPTVPDTMTTRHKSKTKTSTKKVEFDSSSNEEKPPPKSPTRQVSYRGSNCFTQQTHQQNHSNIY